MQFGQALERLLTHIVHADPRFGPVYIIKVDISDGFYRIHIRPQDVPKLGVAYPTPPGEPKLIAFPLVLPMGWTESPPYFCSVTETIADNANARLLRNEVGPPHRLELEADTAPPQPSPPTHTTSCVTPVPTQRNPNLTRRRRILGLVDVFVDDFLALAQGAPTRRHRIRRLLFNTIDDILRPLSDTDDTCRTEPISVKKLRKGDASWSTLKQVLGWVVDTVAMTISLPHRRLNRLDQLLQSIPPTQHRLSRQKWHQRLGELRSMAIALPELEGYSPTSKP